MHIYSHRSKHFSLSNSFSSFWEIYRPGIQTVSKINFLDSVKFTLLGNKVLHSSITFFSQDITAMRKPVRAWLQTFGSSWSSVCCQGTSSAEPSPSSDPVTPPWLLPYVGSQWPTLYYSYSSVKLPGFFLERPPNLAGRGKIVWELYPTFVAWSFQNPWRYSFSFDSV